MGWYRRSFRSRLFPGLGDIHLSATQDRQHVRHGSVVSLTHSFESHLFQAANQAQRLLPGELLSFYVTEEETAEEAGLSPAAMGFNRENPFVFSDRVVRGSSSWYIQDTFSPLQDLSINAGLRSDHTSLLVSDSQLSPRVGIVYYVPLIQNFSQGILQPSVRAPPGGESPALFLRGSA